MLKLNCLIALSVLCLLSCSSKKKFLAECSKYCREKVEIVKVDSFSFDVKSDLPLLPIYQSKSVSYSIDTLKKIITIECHGSEKVTIERITIKDSAEIVRLRGVCDSMSLSYEKYKSKSSEIIAGLDNDLAVERAKKKSNMKFIFILLGFIFLLFLLIYLLKRRL